MMQWLKTTTVLTLSAALLLAAGCAGGKPPVESLPDSTEAAYSSEPADGSMSGNTTAAPADTTASAASAASAVTRATRSTTCAAAVSCDDNDFVFEDDWIVTGATAAPEVEESFPAPAGDRKIYGVGYDHTKDMFYQKKRVRVTWLNVRNGSTEFWWAELAKSTSVNGIRVNINGTYTCMDSNNAVHRRAVAAAAFDAGIDALAMDLTNGFSGWRAAASDYERLCYENGKKYTQKLLSPWAQAMH